MVVHDLNILRTFRRPHEAHAELVVNANTVLTGTVALQRFQPIARRHAQVVKFPGRFSIASLRMATGSMFTNRLARSPPNSACVSAHLTTGWNELR